MGGRESAWRRLAPTMRPSRLAVVQSNYIPWKGYFDLINSVDEFILYDDAQYTRRDWRNRNRIKTRDGPRWLTIPVEVKSKYHQSIRDVRTSDPNWARRHWESIRHNYARARYFREYEKVLSGLYLGPLSHSLSDINRMFIEAVCAQLGIKTKISWSSEYVLSDGRNDRLVALCQQAGATHYLSGPSARGYLDEKLFAAFGISVSYADYSGYQEYPQLFPPFEHAVSILDLLLNVGADAKRYMKSFC